MAQLPLKGLIGGHKATAGWFSSIPSADAFLSILESQLGVSPIIRVRIDFDRDGVYEEEELEDVISVSNIDRVVEYFSNRPRFGSGSFTVGNNDLRFTDTNSDSLTYYNPNIVDPTLRIRYINAPVLIELGFDGVYRGNDAYWVSLFKGFITSKEENIIDKTATFNLLDEWSFISSLPLSQSIPYNSLFETTSGDAHVVNYGLFYGHHEFLPAENQNKDGQILIPLECRKNGTRSGQLYISAVNRLYIRSKLPLPEDTDEYWAKFGVYVWLYNKDQLVSPATDEHNQWLLIDESQIQYNVVGIGAEDLDFIPSSEKLTCYRADGSTCQLKVGTSGAEYFDPSAEGYAPAFALETTDALPSNPSEILYRALNDYAGINYRNFNISDSEVQNWSKFNKDFSFEASYFSLSSCAVTVHGTTGSLGDLINKCCEVSRGAFFIAQGKEIVGGIPTRRIEFIVSEPRLYREDLQITNNRVFNPVISKDIIDIKNDVTVNNFDFNGTAKKETVTGYNYKNAYSMAAYGAKQYSFGGTPNDILFLCNSSIYAAYSAKLYIDLFAEPLHKIQFESDISSLKSDLKTLFSIVSAEDALDDTDLSAIFEVYGFRFDTRRFQITITGQWAGYLIAPDASPTKRWAFLDYCYLDEDSNGIEYYLW